MAALRAMLIRLTLSHDGTAAEAGKRSHPQHIDAAADSPIFGSVQRNCPIARHPPV